MIVDFIFENYFFACLVYRHMYVFKIHVRAYFRQQLSIGISALIRFICNNSKCFFSRYSNYKTTGILGWRVSQMDENANNVT